MFKDIWDAIKTVILFLATAKIVKDHENAKVRKNNSRIERALNRWRLRQQAK